MRVFCAEGSHDAITNTMLPDPNNQLIEHDFSRGPWWPEKTYDVAWSVEFWGHGKLQYMPNYITAFRKAAMVVVEKDGTTLSLQKFSFLLPHYFPIAILTIVSLILNFLLHTHQVEVHKKEWWIRKYESWGLNLQS